jgi:hypothetical protein
MFEIAKYRANVATCRRMADQSSDALEKRKWLEMAESWRLLLICSDVLPVKENNDAATSTGHPGSPRPAVLSRITAPRSMINILRMREWLTRKA